MTRRANLGARVEVLMNGGFTEDASDFVVMSIATAIDQVYYVPHFEMVARRTTNLPARTAMRGREIQACS